MDSGGCRTKKWARKVLHPALVLAPCRVSRAVVRLQHEPKRFIPSTSHVPDLIAGLAVVVFRAEYTNAGLEMDGVAHIALPLTAHLRSKFGLYV